jgi:MMP endo-(1,4)-3-O-methyl-alpha-D-mannosidase
MYKAITPSRARYPRIDVAATTRFIMGVQKKDGEIPWSAGGKTDPWDHVESAMGLTVGGCHQEAKKAYIWSAQTQLEDGSWWSYYEDGKPQEGAYKDSNMTAYIAVGMLHYFLSTGDRRFLREIWHTVSKAMDYVISLQRPGGEILWAKRADGSVDETALLTGSSSIYISLDCALHMARILGEERPHWERAKMRLGEALRHKPHLFDQSKSRFSMDWYYPVLCGAVTGNEAHQRIERSWNTFIVPDLGVLCVCDNPWVTMAETAELVLSLCAIEHFDTAELVFGWLTDKRYDDGAFWTGLTFPDGEIYTREKTAWTAAAVLLAADSLYDLTPASGLFRHRLWER